MMVKRKYLTNKYILENIDIKPEITFTYFVPDNRKSGGKYIEKTGIIRKIDMVEQYVQFIDKSKINISDIIEIESHIFISLYND